MDWHRGVRITSTGFRLPATPKSSLTRPLDSGIEGKLGELYDRGVDAWIAREESAVELGTAAAREAIERAGIAPREVDLVLTHAMFNDWETPKDSCAIAAAVGAENASAYFVDAACASFLAMTNIAAAFVRSGAARHVLVVNVAHWVLRGMRPDEDAGPGGDGAAAVVLSASEVDHLLCHREVRSPVHAEAMMARSTFATGEREYLVANPRPDFRDYLYDDVPALCRGVLDAARLRPQEVDWFVSAQPSGGIMHKWAGDTGLRAESVLHTFPRYGNLITASVPANLHHFTVVEPLIRRGDTVLFFSTGAGFQLMASVWKY